MVNFSGDMNGRAVGEPTLSGTEFRGKERQFVEEIFLRINFFGYSHVLDFSERDRFEKMTRRMGNVWNVTDVRIEAGSHAMVTSPSDLSLHTDHPQANVIGWYCEEPCPYQAPTLLVDLGDVQTRLSRRDLELLSQIYTPVPGMSGAYSPILLFQNGRVRLNYLDWFPAQGLVSDEHKAALRHFQELIQFKKDNELTSVALRKGEMLFIDNNRMLHGRDFLAADTPRHLVRHWIKVNEQIVEL